MNELHNHIHIHIAQMVNHRGPCKTHWVVVIDMLHRLWQKGEAKQNSSMKDQVKGAYEHPVLSS